MASEHVREILRILNNVNEITKGDKPSPQGLAVLADMLSKDYTAEEVANVTGLSAAVETEQALEGAQATAKEIALRGRGTKRVLR